MVSGALVAGLAIPLAGWSSPFSSCDWGAGAPRPDWVNNPDYVLSGYQVAVGSAAHDGKSKDEQRSAAENDAKKHLVQKIQVTIKAEDEQNTRISEQTVRKEASSKVTVSAEEDLRGLKNQSSWVDKETCTYYTLMVISNESLAQSQREKNMKGRLAKFKELLAEGRDDKKNRDLKIRRKYLEDAQVLLADIDFALLPDELGKNIYAKRLEEALLQVSKEAAKVKGRMALFALNEDHSLNADVLGRMLDQLRSGDMPTDRLMADCASQQECISIAKDSGYTMLTMLTASSNVVTSQMGSLKGTLTVSRTVYDIDSRKAVKGPDKVSTQVIGWSREELDWGAAAEKAMQNFK
jgi:hypothetical protein